MQNDAGSSDREGLGVGAAVDSCAGFVVTVDGQVRRVEMKVGVVGGEDLYVELAKCSGRGDGVAFGVGEDSIGSVEREDVFEVLRVHVVEEALRRDVGARWPLRRSGLL
jgi:hypothetical protein